jgi:hypothetical protein
MSTTCIGVIADEGIEEVMLFDQRRSFLLIYLE